MILIGNAYTAEVLGSGGFMSNIPLSSTKAGAHYLPTHQPDPPLHRQSLIRSRQGWNAMFPKEKMLKELPSLSAGITGAAFPYLQCLTHSRCCWCLTLIYAWSHQDIRGLLN